MKKVYTKLSILAFLLIGFAAISYAAGSITFNPTFPYDFGNRVSTYTQKFTVAASGLTSNLVLTSSNPAITISLNQSEGFSSQITINQSTTNRDIFVKFNPASANGALSAYIYLTGSGLDQKLFITACDANNLYETFDVSSVDITTERDVTYGTNSWHLKGTNVMGAGDRRLGAKSVRLTNTDDCMQMNFDRENVGRVSFLYASTGSESGGGLKVQYSDNRGLTWLDAGTVGSTPLWSGEWSICNADVNIVDPIRIRIIKTDNGHPINIDHFCINNFALPDISLRPKSLSFGNISVYGTISSTKTITMKGFNLSSNVLLQSNNPAFKLSLNGTLWVSSLTIARTSLSSAVNVLVKFEPNAVGDYSGTIAISGTGLNKIIPVSGYGVAAGLSDDFYATYTFEDMSVGDPNTKTSAVTSASSTFDPGKVGFGNFSQNGLTSTNQTAKAFNFTGWGNEYGEKCYQITLTPKDFLDEPVTNDYVLTLTDIAFDIIMPSNVSRYKVVVSADNNDDLEHVASFENTSSPDVIVNANEFLKNTSNGGVITGSKVTFTGANFRGREAPITIKIYAATGDGKFGVDNVRVNGICVKDDVPKITVIPGTFSSFPAGYLSTRDLESVPVSESFQLITVNGAKLRGNISIEFSGTHQSYFYAYDQGANTLITELIPDLNHKVENKVIAIYYKPQPGVYGNHIALLKFTTIDGNTISMQLDGYNVPEEYVFIGMSPENPLSWVDPSNWEAGFQAPATVVGQYKPNVKICAPLVGVGVYPEVQCGRLTINTEPYAASDGKIGKLTLKGTANLIVDQILYYPIDANDAARKDKLTIENIYDVNNAMLNPILRFSGKKTISNANKPHLAINQTTNTTGTLETADNYHLLSSPVGQIETADIKVIFDGWFLERFNETMNQWERFGKNGGGWITNTFIESGRGYSVNYESETVLNMYGTLDATSFHDKTFTTTYSSGHGMGYNLLGNPYTGAIDLNDMSSWNGFVDNYEDVIYLWQYTGNYIGVTSNTVMTPDDAIPMCQGFWVIQKESSGANSSFTIPYSSVMWGHNPFYKSAINTYDYVTLRVTADKYADQVRLFEVSTCDTGHDAGYDVKKWTGSVNAPQMYAIEGDNRFSTNSKSDISETTIGFEAGLSPTYTLTANYSIDDRGVYLIDSNNGYIHNFANGSYTFSAVKGEDTNRFKLVVGEAPIGVESANGLINVNVWSYGKNVYVSGYDGEAFIYDVSGLIVKRTVLSGEQQIISIDNPGVYIVKLGSVSQKVIVR